MRSGDNTKLAFFRAKRFFNIESQWYFSTREVCDQGPYMTEELAQAELAAYLRWCKKFEPKTHQSAKAPAKTQQSALPNASYEPAPIAATKSLP